jgi:hypothetical protein
LLGLFFGPEDGGDMFFDFQRTTQLYIPEERTIHNHLCENLKFYDLQYWFTRHHQQQLQGETQARSVSEQIVPSSSGSSEASISCSFMLHNSLGYSIMLHSQMFMPMAFVFLYSFFQIRTS